MTTDKRKKVIAIMGGTFNPIHNGHLMLANYVCEYTPIDELWMMVSPQNPFKVNNTLADDRLRLAMAQAATADYPKIKVSDFEFSMPRPSYTFATLERLSQTHPDCEFVLLIGADNWAVFNKWRNWREIIARYRIYIYRRSGYETESANLPAHVTPLHTPILDVSSTFIRRSINDGKDMRFFVGEAVWKIIKEQHLYTTPDNAAISHPSI